jgi:hypothetical protein
LSSSESATEFPVRKPSTSSRFPSLDVAAVNGEVQPLPQPSQRDAASLSSLTLPTSTSTLEPMPASLLSSVSFFSCENS